MAGHNLKSASITNLDAVPYVPNTIGEGAPGFVTIINDFVSPVSADDTTSTYRLLRFPTNAKVKNLKIYSTLLAAGAADIDVAFSDSTTDGTPQSLNALANPVVLITASADNKLFGAAKNIFVASATVPLITTIIDCFQGTFTPAMQNIPMWQNLVTLGATQFTSDPGGFFDIYVKVTTAITTGGLLSGEMTYVE
jgi:hypothetical protein